MAALVAAIHVFAGRKKDVDARDKPAHDDVNLIGKRCSQCTDFLITDS
jgi:hypothetical protein